MVDRVDGMKTVSFDPGSVFVFFFFAKTLFGFTGQRIGRTEDVWQRRAFQLHAVPQELDWPTLHGLVAGLVYGPWSIWRKSSHRPPLSVCFTSVFLRLCVFFSSQKSGAIVLTNGYVHDYEPWGKWLRLECSVFNHVWSVHIGKKKQTRFRRYRVRARRFIFYSHSSDSTVGEGLKIMVLVVVVVPVLKLIPCPPLPPYAWKSSKDLHIGDTIIMMDGDMRKWKRS